jgi:hypothetical protein
MIAKTINIPIPEFLTSGDFWLGFGCATTIFILVILWFMYLMSNFKVF